MARITDEDLLVREAAEEDEDDLKIGPSTALLSASDWTVGTLLDQLRGDRIELRPSFQRREAWDDKRKSRFIESLLLNLPIPQIVLAERKERRGSYLVIDGKQRLLAIWRFAATADDEAKGLKKLALTGLEAREDLNGTSWASMAEDSSFSEDLDALENQTIRTVVIKNWGSADFLHLVFLRLNTGSVSLSPQELRQALHPGSFVTYADEYSGKSKAIRKLFGKDQPDFRMRDVEVFVRFIGFKLFLASYRGNLKAFLDKTCADLNRDWSSREREVQRLGRSCDAAIETTIEIFGENAFTRWGDGAYEGRFNRAIFDAMAYYFSDPVVAKAARAKARTVETAFRRLCDQNADFVEAVQTTTKTAEATHTRLAAWGTGLSKALNIPLKVPKLEGTKVKRIVP